ncbi:MAG: hypothetical protein HQK83_13750 [Fibrobacteria bacterium]|nr:hypothetical protein [Fibrobacteria bacterium]
MNSKNNIPPDSNDSLSFLTVERYLNGDLSKKELQTFEEALQGNSKWAEYVAKARLQKSSLNFEAVQRAIEARKGKTGKVENERSVWQQLVRFIQGQDHRPMLAFATVLSIALCWSILHFISRGLESDNSTALASKGQTGIYLYIGGALADTLSDVYVSPGDTLKFTYRMNTYIHAQVWYRDDNGEYTPYIKDGETSVRVPGSSSWQFLKKQIIMDSLWRVEELKILYSNKPFSVKHARKALVKNKNGILFRRYLLRNRAPSGK